jgi:hypothetical protein
MEMSDRLRRRFNASDEFHKIRLQGVGAEQHNRDAILHRIVPIGFVFSRSSEGGAGALSVLVTLRQWSAEFSGAPEVRPSSGAKGRGRVSA